MLNFGPTWSRKDEEKMDKEEFNASFVLSCFSSYSSIKMWHLYLENEKQDSAFNVGPHLSFLKPFQY